MRSSSDRQLDKSSDNVASKDRVQPGRALSSLTAATQRVLCALDSYNRSFGAI
jgi:hypothetical protein